ncbi:hypothetical protein CHLV4139_05035 [Campylobacter helveticus]|uniref:hypothetical protein n=1 Tax=Campylobacter helveticus TaxID=28898 RepID=UPI00214CF9B6|nr:hypothetical protein [Campylobacter helveticus]MCR2054863.1 hypothetical protein [Campylobacter helveticus]
MNDKNLIDYVIKLPKKDMLVLDALVKLNAKSNIVFACEDEEDEKKVGFLFTELLLGADYNFYGDEININKDYFKIKALLKDETKDKILEKLETLLMTYELKDKILDAKGKNERFTSNKEFYHLEELLLNHYEEKLLGKE